MNQAVAEKMESQSSRSMAQTPHGSSTDLRSWLRAVEQMGEIRTVEGADWNLELGAIAELNTRLKPTPALMFDKIKDYPAGYRVLTASTASRRRLLLPSGCRPISMTAPSRKRWWANPTSGNRSRAALLPGS